MFTKILGIERLLVAGPVTALFGLLISSAALTAWGATTDAWYLELGIPSATQTALRSGDGTAWDELRQNGLTYRLRGSGEVSLVMFVLAVKDGRVFDSWTSRSFQAAAGSGRISGRYLPAIQKARVSRTSTASRPIDAGKLVNVAKAANAGNAGNAGNILPSDMMRGTVVVMFIAPASGASGSQTSPLFARTDPINDL